MSKYDKSKDVFKNLRSAKLMLHQTADAAQFAFSNALFSRRIGRFQNRIRHPSQLALRILKSMRTLANQNNL